MNLLFLWERRKHELQEELEAHIRLAVEERIARGQSPQEARRAAICELGNPLLVSDVTRQQWGWEWLEKLGPDLRYAVRQIRKTPGYTLTAVLTLTLAVGANTAIFALLYALLLRSLPVERPDQIVQLKLQLSASGVRGEPGPFVSDALYDLLSRTQTVFAGMCGWQEYDLNLRETDGTRPVPAASLTGGCMRVLGLRAALGRLLQDADDNPASAGEGFPVVLAYDYWRTHFAADPSVLGRQMQFGASMRSGPAKGIIVGVLAPGFESVQVGGRPNFYVPLAMTDPAAQHNLGSFDTSLVARLREGVSAPAAQAQVDAVFQAKLKEDKRLRYFTFISGKFVEADQVHVLVVPGRTGYFYLRQLYEKPLYLIEGMVGLSLLVACAYLAMLASARALGRRRELALRMALGASRRRLAAQLVWESVLLAAAGGGLGTLLAWGAERGLLAMIQTSGSDRLELHTGLIDRIAHTPGVESVSLSQAFPLEGGTYMEQVSSQPASGGIRTDNSLTELSVTPGYFATLGVPILQGRNFTLDERGEQPNVCILNRSAAEYFFPDGGALGSALTMGKDIRMRVVGIVGDTLYNDLRQSAPRIIYQPLLQGGLSHPLLVFAVRASDPGTAVSAVRNSFRELAPDLAVDKPVTMTELVASAMARERMMAFLAGFFALLTLTLTGIGLYGVLNYSVVRRRTEIGVRMALGATPGGVMTMILRDAMRLVLPGVALGGAGVWAVTRLLGSLLYGVRPLDPQMCALSVAVLVATALLACALPARRAAAVHPVEALRFE
ncbi:FtsX-like permease family protein [Acidobacteria bacterium AB60]|nr:FtsX-like permease family protein [Acidobacteria bacterium AB60]